MGMLCECGDSDLRLQAVLEDSLDWNSKCYETVVGRPVSESWDVLIKD